MAPLIQQSQIYGPFAHKRTSIQFNLGVAISRRLHKHQRHLFISFIGKQGRENQAWQELAHLIQPSRLNMQRINAGHITPAFHPAIHNIHSKQWKIQRLSFIVRALQIKLFYSQSRIIQNNRHIVARENLIYFMQDDIQYISKSMDQLGITEY